MLAANLSGADLQGVVLMMEALAEMDSCSADARCLESLIIAAKEFSTRLAQGQAFQPSDLCRVGHLPPALA